MTRARVSVCVITLNEEHRLCDCLQSVPFADELIVVDSHSTDATRDIAEAAGARVIERDWPGHIEQKNFAIDQATHDWVLCLDADERLSDELQQSVLAALERDDPPAGFTCNRRTHYLGRWIDHGGWYPDRKLRLFRRSGGRWGGVNPHDHVHLEGTVEHLRGDLLHYSYDSIADHLNTINLFTTIAAREKHKRGGRGSLVSLLLRPGWKFLRMYVFRAGFLDGRAGLIVALLGSYYVFLKYAKLTELSRGWISARDDRRG